MNQSRAVAIALGSNKGDRLSFLRLALERLTADLFLHAPRQSSVYETAPWGGVATGAFLNGVVVGTTDWKPPAILNYLKQLERDLGRVSTVRNADREIDLDILLWGSQVWNSDGVVVPHPSLSERDFVLLPLAEVAPDWVHPLLGQSAAQLLAAWKATHVTTAKVFAQPL